MKRLLVVIQLKTDSTIQRLQHDAPKIIRFLEGISRGELEMAFRSNDGLLFGYFVKTATPQFIRPEFEKCDGTQNGDSILAFEAGELAAGIGFSRAWTWLQHH